MNSVIDEELFEAVWVNNLPEVRRLLSVGAAVNAKNNYGWTPLHYYASMRGHVQVVKVLREPGADIAATTRLGVTPNAAIEGHLAILVRRC
jgi:hypothetical protein